MQGPPLDRPDWKSVNSNATNPQTYPHPNAINSVFIVCNFKMPHPIHDILFLVHTVHLQLEIFYAFPTPPATSSPPPFRGCTFKLFGRSLPFRYASQICLKLHTAIKSVFHFLH